MPYVRVNNRHKGDDGRVRVPGDVVHVSSAEAEKRTRDGQVREAKADEMPKPKPRPKPASRPAVKALEPEKKPGEGK